MLCFSDYNEISKTELRAERFQHYGRIRKRGRFLSDEWQNRHDLQLPASSIQPSQSVSMDDEPVIIEAVQFEPGAESPPEQVASSEGINKPIESRRIPLSRLWNFGATVG